MAFRSDVSVDWSVSPRIVTVQAPSTEIVVQDLVDTLRELEQQQANLVYPSLISAAGKETLGGGVLVGITATLVDAQVAFQARDTESESGTVTTGGTTTFTDTSADFVTAGVARGSSLVNYTDGSVADVRSVLSATELETTALTGGVDNDWDVSDDYGVFNVEQCNVSGGNLVAVDAADSEITAILPTFGTQVVRTASSSATLQELSTLQFSSFNGAVTVDIANGVSGTAFPKGTEQEPVNNFDDALTIAQARGFLSIRVLGDATINGGLDFTNFKFIGQGINLSTLTINTAAGVLNTTFEDATVTGVLDGMSRITGCKVSGLSFVSGVLEDCILESTVTLDGTDTAIFERCISGVPGAASTPVIDMGGSGSPLAVRDYYGGLELRNRTGTDAVSIDMASGQVIIDSTVSAGTISIRGISRLVDNSTGTAVIDSAQLIQPEQITDMRDRVVLLEKLQRNRLETNPNTGVMTLYDDDSVTPLLTSNIYEDVAETQAYRGQGAERRNRLV